MIAPKALPEDVAFQRAFRTKTSSRKIPAAIRSSPVVNRVKQVQSEGGRADEKRAPAARPQPLILKRETGQRQQHDVVVLLHVLRIVQVRSAEQQCQDAENGFLHGKRKLAQKAECDERSQNVNQDACQVDNHDAAHGRIVFVIGENRQPRDAGSHQVRGQHEQALADPEPAVEPPAAANETELGIFIGKDLRLRGPEPVRGLQPVHGIGSAEFSRLHNEGQQRGNQA